MLDQLKPAPASRRPRKRLGRGIGSGLGKTSGRGQKGAGARSGFKRRVWFEGGQMPLARRLPKRGFTNLARTTHEVVNLGALERFAADAVIDGQALADAGLIPRGARTVKVLAEGEITHPVVLRVDAISANAARKVEAAGGRVELVANERRKQETTAQ